MFLKSIFDTALIYFKWLKIIVKSSLSKKKHPHSNDKTLLLLASNLPPNSGGGVFRPLSFIKNAGNNQWHCRAVGFDYGVQNSEAGSYLLNKLEDPNALAYVPLSELQPSWRLTPRIDGGLDNCFNMVDFIINDDSICPDVIMATGPRFNTFLSAYYLSKYYHCPLVIDYRDEWSLCPFSWIQKEASDKFFENMIAKQARKIIFTTQSHIDNHAGHFPDIDNHKRILIANGYEQEDLAGLKPSNTNNRCFTLSFIGALGDHALPTHFLSDLDSVMTESPELVKSTCIQFVGDRSAKANEALDNFKFSENIILTGHVSKAEALQLMQQSDALLILAGTGMKSYIPGKLFDYLSFKKPIIYYGEAGETSAIINKLGVGFSVEHDNSKALAIALSSLINKKITIKNERVEQWLKNYTRTELAKKLYNELDLLVKS